MTRRAVHLCLAIAAAGMLALPAPATAGLAGEVHEGATLLSSIEAGRTGCAEIAGSGFDAIGEYAMARYVGDGRAHEAMNRRMSLMMGEAGEARMHAALGRRYSGCGGGRAGWIDAMAGMMDGSNGGQGPGMMDGRRAEPGPGMARGSHWGGGSGGISTAALVALLAAVAAAAAVLTLWLSRRARPQGG
ncbi:MAG: hypothetical protein U0R26_11875 [Solirubrobacterales bacterium]